MKVTDHAAHDDENLLARARDGDEAAFLELYQHHRDAVYRFAYRLLGAQAAAEDVTHDCFMSLLQHAARYDGRRAQLRTYLLAAARNLCFKHFRRHAPETVWDTDAWESVAETEDAGPLRQVLTTELAAEVRRAVLGLPPLQREALILFEYEEMSLAEIAGVVGADTNTVKARLHRARRNLRETLAPYWYGHAAHAEQEAQR